jgi:hypothetical protein
MATIIWHHTSAECRNWVDDFVLFRSPTPSLSSNPDNLYPYDLSLVQQLADTLGWPWKPSKTQPFASSFRYLGFIWDLKAKSVHIPDEKRTKYLRKLNEWLAREKHSRKEAESLLGTLVHCSLAIPDGRSRLPALSHFVTSFNGKSLFSQRTPSPTSIRDILWWQECLQSSMPGSSIKPPPPPTDIDLWVDASTSFGIGVVFDHEWDSWELLHGWDHNPQRKIGWAETVALECGIRLAIHRGAHNVHIVIKSDNMGVIGALAGGKSRNNEQNTVLQRITTILHTHSLWVSTLYTPSSLNLADPPSRGIPLDNLIRSPDTFILPDVLIPLLLSQPVLPK